MYVSTEAIINQFLRTFPDTFTARQLSHILARAGIKFSVPECKEYLETSPYVFALENKLYITRAGAFTGKWFSFKPAKGEIERQVFIAGHRCMPFVDSEVLSNSLQFYFRGNRLPNKVIEIESSSALNFFSLYGEEYSSQYIASDPANKTLNLVQSDFELPFHVKLTGFSFKPILEYCHFHYGDRLLCKLQDWDNGKIEVVPLLIKEDRMRMAVSDVERQEWYEILENALLQEFKKMGPCSCIEEQLANAFFEYHNELCSVNCGSVEEYLQYSKKVGIEYFGVETRFWYRGQDVPAVGPWNKTENRNLQADEKHGIIDIPDFIVDSYLNDFMYQKKTDLKELVETVLSKSFVLTPDEKKYFLLHLTNRNVILLKKYNWFADFITGAVRHRALKLYNQISTMIYAIDSTGKDLARFPQQELVILSQLFSHLTHILESVENEPATIAEDLDEMMLSLEGMEYNFEDIKDQLYAAVSELHKGEFTVI